MVKIVLVAVLLFAPTVRGEETDAGQPACVCVEGKLADELARLRIENRLLKAAAIVNRKIEEKRRASKP